MQQFWYSVTQELSTQKFYFQLEDQVIEVNAGLLCNALNITPKVTDHPFISPAPKKEIIIFINNIGCNTPFKGRRVHIIKLDTPLGNLKFTNKGLKDPIFGMPILEVMLNDDIKASTNYLQYLAKFTVPAHTKEVVKSTKTVPAIATGRGKGLLTKNGVSIPKRNRTQTVTEEIGQSKEAVANEADSEATDEEEIEPLVRRRSTSLSIYRKTDQAFEVIQEGLDHSKKLKGLFTPSEAAQHNSDMKKAQKASKNDFFIQQRTKGPSEGSSAIPKVFGEQAFKSLNEDARILLEVPDESRSSTSESELAVEDISGDDEEVSQKADKITDNTKEVVTNANEVTEKADEVTEKAEDVADKDDIVTENVEMIEVEKNTDAQVTEEQLPETQTGDKDTVESKVQSMVDVPVKQATLATLRHPPIDTTVILNPDQATNPPSQPLPTQPNRSKTKRLVKKSSHPNPQDNSSSLETRVIPVPGLALFAPWSRRGIVSPVYATDTFYLPYFKLTTSASCTEHTTDSMTTATIMIVHARNEKMTEIYPVSNQFNITNIGLKAQASLGLQQTQPPAPRSGLMATPAGPSNSPSVLVGWTGYPSPSSPSRAIARYQLLPSTSLNNVLIEPNIVKNLDTSLGKHVRLPFSLSETIVKAPFNIIHSDLWTSPILLGFRPGPAKTCVRAYVALFEHKLITLMVPSVGTKAVLLQMVASQLAGPFTWNRLIQRLYTCNNPPGFQDPQHRQILFNFRRSSVLGFNRPWALVSSGFCGFCARLAGLHVTSPLHGHEITLCIQQGLFSLCMTHREPQSLASQEDLIIVLFLRKLNLFPGHRSALNGTSLSICARRLSFGCCQCGGSNLWVRNLVQGIFRYNASTLLQYVFGDNSELPSRSPLALFNALYLSFCTDELDMKQIIDEPSPKPKRRRDDHDKDPSACADKHSKKRQPDSSKNDKDQAGTSKQETYARECVEDAVPTPTTPVLNKSKWFLELKKSVKAPEDFNDVLGTTFDFSNFIKYRLNKDTVTKADLEGPVFELFKGSCKSCIELEYHFEHAHGRQYILAEFFFNQDLEYIKTGNLEERKYTASFIKTKSTRYELYEIEEMIQGLWSPYKVDYDKDVAFKISHRGPKWKLFYRARQAIQSDHIVYSRMKILSIVRITVEKHCRYGYLKGMVVKRANQKEYMFKEADFPSLHLNDIEDMFLLYYQNKLHHLDGKFQTTWLWHFGFSF
ncbi:hypothetical protein Tco_0968330 [Tanacetum coccineum]